MDIVEVLCKKYPNYSWEIDTTYDTLRWNESNAIPKPTIEEIEKGWNEVISEKPYEKLRIIRNKLLSDTDFMFTSDYDMDDGIRQKWVTYRKALRDLPASPITPSLDANGRLTNVTFPEKPTS